MKGKKTGEGKQETGGTGNWRNGEMEKRKPEERRKGGKEKWKSDFVRL